MESAQVIAAFIAGIVSPFVQEVLFGAKISGRLAAWVAMAVTLVIATLAHWATGGFADAGAIPAFSLLDPSAFFGFWWKVWAPVYVLAQVIYSTTTRTDGSGPVQRVATAVRDRTISSA